MKKAALGREACRGAGVAFSAGDSVLECQTKHSTEPLIFGQRDGKVFVAVEFTTSGTTTINMPDAAVRIFDMETGEEFALELVWGSSTMKAAQLAGHLEIVPPMVFHHTILVPGHLAQ